MDQQSPKMRWAAALIAAVAVAACSNSERGRGRQDHHQPEASVLSAPDATTEAGASATRDASVTEPDHGDADVPESSSRAGSSKVPPLALRGWDQPGGKVDRGAAWRLYQLGRRALEAKNYEGAERFMTEAIEADHSFEAAYGGLSFVHLRSKNNEACVEASQRCVSKVFNPDRLGACYFNLGKCLERLDEDRAALEAYRTSLESRESDVVQRALKATARRLDVESPEVERRSRDARVKAAARALLRRSCKAPITASEDVPGLWSCGSASVWGAAGSFTAPDAREALLVIHDERIAQTDGRGHGVLMRLSERGVWELIARTRSLSPGEGGADIEALFPLPDGRLLPVLQVSDCRRGCCSGSVRTLGFETEGEDLDLSVDVLFPVGSGRPSPEVRTRKAMVTGARGIDADGDGRSEQLLLRYEARVAPYNPVIHYMRYRLAGTKLMTRDALPPASALPDCEAAEAADAGPRRPVS